MMQTELCKELHIQVPIILAGMAGGPTTAELVAAVSNAGGLGTLGAAYMQPEEIRSTVRRIQQLTDRPFAVNLFAPQAPVRSVIPEQTLRQINLSRGALGLEPLTVSELFADNSFDRQIEAVLEERVPVISMAFGLLPESYVIKAKQSGVKLLITATSVQEAIEAEKSGADAIVAQGSEAGGHRSTFDVSRTPQGQGHNVGTMALVPAIVDSVAKPVIAAGAIMDGRGAVAAFALDAQAVQMGTRFLTATESGAHAAYQSRLLSSKETDTVLTNALSGRPARAVANRFVEQWTASEAAPLPFPLQNELTRDMRKTAAARDNSDYMALWAGQGVRLAAAGMSAAEIVRKITEEYRQVLEIMRA